ncbi:GPI transamidase component PIG-S isoform X2 [Aricia agestis]|uniref:GPI transamidase component PIG-S isoform X2 n=1 Tax=Aricia agestis TaxID=91739 RepID=UPI001C20B391|nr:GPI transamidase component PIG-S isoform X2 [Aricia agestis]
MEGESNRMWASASFVGVLIIIGLPLWWKTTEVYRVTLPYSEISSFDTESHHVATQLKVLANSHHLAEELAGKIRETFKEYDAIKLNIITEVLPGALRQTLESVADEGEATEEVGAVYDLYKHNTFYVVQRTPLFTDVWVGGERVAFFRDAKAVPTLCQALLNWIYQPSILHGARSQLADAARQVRSPGGAEYHIVLSVVHPDPQHLRVDFNAGEVMEDYIGSFVDELSELHNFTLKSQWLHLLDFDFQLKEVRDSSPRGRHFTTRQERLPLLLTRLEARAAHVSQQPALNLALYAVPCAAAPLRVHADEENDSPVQAFMSPKWGGVVLASPTAAECEAGVFKPPVKLVMGTFISQLRKLLGITDKEAIPGAHLDPLRAVSPRRWEVDALLRIRTLEHVTSAERSLKSLAKLLGEISNIVINDEVGVSISEAVTLTAAARAHATAGELRAAYDTARRADTAAETAFMEPSLLALLYFPDDQKYAIYIPLFLPIMFPVVLSLRNLLRWLRGKPAEKEKTE